MEEQLKKPLHVKEGKAVITKKESQGTSSTTGKVEVNKGETSGKIEVNEEPSTKEKMKSKKEDMGEQIEDIKEGVKEQKEDYEKESEKEGRTPAEKVLNDIVSRFRQGTDQINDAIYNKPESEEKEGKEKEPKEALKPLVDVLETNDTVYLIADISGIKKENISLGISKKSVEITVKYMDDPDIEDAKFVQKERSYGKTHRKVQLGSEVKVHEAKANFRNCTLKITLPKVVEDVTKVNIDD